MVRTCPNWGKIWFDLCDLDLLHGHCLCQCQLLLMRGVCDEKTDRIIRRAAWSQLKIKILLHVIRRPLGNLPLHKYVVHSHSLGRVAIPDWSQARGDTHVSVKSSQVQIIACLVLHIEAETKLLPFCSQHFHIEAETKLLPFCSRHFQMHILVSKGPINSILALVSIMPWHQPGDIPLSEPMMVRLLTHIFGTWPQNQCWHITDWNPGNNFQLHHLMWNCWIDIYFVDMIKLIYV